MLFEEGILLLCFTGLSINSYRNRTTAFSLRVILGDISSSVSKKVFLTSNAQEMGIINHH